MPEVILLCGKICSGKTTYAQRLRTEKNAVILSCDELMLTLFPQGAGEHHDLLAQRAPSVYFDPELCAHYFTYMRTGQSAHFVLYDNASSMRKKLVIAAALGIREGFLPLPEREEYLQTLLD